MNPTITIPFPVQSVPCDTTSLAANEQLTLSGTYGRQRRYLLVVTNLDTAGQALTLLSANSKPLLTYFALTSIGLPLNEDLILWNQNANPVSFQVLQIYFDEGLDEALPQNFPGRGLRAGAVQATRIDGNRSGVFGGTTGNPRNG